MTAQAQCDELLQRFGSEIAAAAEAMVVGEAPTDAELPEVSIAPLRRLHEQAERYLRVADAANTQFLLFFLSSFLQDIFYNLSGDVPYEAESRRYQQKFFVDLAKNLADFSSAIADRDSARSLDVCEQMISSYLQTVTRINDLLEQERTADAIEHS